MTASYPTSIKSFTTYQDQPGPDATTIDRAVITNEIHDEVIAVEQTIGPFGSPTVTVIPGTGSLGDEIDALYNGKSPLGHNHVHAEMSGLDADDHLQYMRVDAARAFVAPCPGVDAVAASQLITMRQATNRGWLNTTQVNTIILAEIAEESPYPMVCGLSPPEGHGIDRSQRYRMTGGMTQGYTDSNGRIRIDYSRANFRGVLTLVYMKMPYPGTSAFGYIYRYEEDQLTLTQVDNTGAWIQFAEDIVVDKQAWVALTWMVVGV